MNLDQLIQKTPKPILVISVLGLALAFFVLNEPLKDECTSQINIFSRNTQGVLTEAQTNKKKQYPQINYSREFCLNGNSRGACENYFNHLKIFSSQLKSFSPKCQIKYSEQDSEFISHMRKGVSAMALLAWGDAPPAGPANRLGWLTEADVKTFCALRSNYLAIVGEEEFIKFRNEVYKLLPDAWSDKIPIESRIPEDRPKIYKAAPTNENGILKESETGTLKESEIYSRSLFSMRCDLYL